MLALVEWMCAFNRDHPDDPVRFAGVGVDGIDETTYGAVTDHVRTVLPERLAELEGHYAALRPGGWSGSEWKIAAGRARAAYGLVAALPADQAGHAWALQNARLIVDFHELVESVLGSGPLDGYVLDLGADRPGPVAAWLGRPALTRVIGPRYDPDHDGSDHMSGGSLAEWFDVVVHWQHVTASRPLRPGE